MSNADNCYATDNAQTNRWRHWLLTCSLIGGSRVALRREQSDNTSINIGIIETLETYFRDRGYGP